MTRGFHARHLLVAQVQGLAGAVREVGDHHVGPFDETLEDLRPALRLQVDGHAALVAVGQVPAVVAGRRRARRNRAQQALRVTHARRLDLDDVGPEVRQHRCCGGRGDKARYLNDFQAGKHGLRCLRCRRSRRRARGARLRCRARTRRGGGGARPLQRTRPALADARALRARTSARRARRATATFRSRLDEELGLEPTRRDARGRRRRSSARRTSRVCSCRDRSEAPTRAPATRADSPARADAPSSTRSRERSDGTRRRRHARPDRGTRRGSARRDCSTSSQLGSTACASDAHAAPSSSATFRTSRSRRRSARRSPASSSRHVPAGTRADPPRAQPRCAEAGVRRGRGARSARRARRRARAARAAPRRPAPGRRPRRVAALAYLRRRGGAIAGAVVTTARRRRTLGRPPRPPGAGRRRAARAALGGRARRRSACPSCTSRPAATPASSPKRSRTAADAPVDDARRGAARAVPGRGATGLSRPRRRGRCSSSRSTPEPLADILDADPTALTEELERLCERRILRVDGLRFRFRYDLVRQVLLRKHLPRPATPPAAAPRRHQPTSRRDARRPDDGDAATRNSSPAPSSSTRASRPT